MLFQTQKKQQQQQQMIQVEQKSNEEVEDKAESLHVNCFVLDSHS